MSIDELAAKYHSMSIEVNPHRNDYTTPYAYFVDTWPREEPPPGINTWESLAVVQIYPRTPVDFVLGFGQTISEAVEQAVRATLS